MDTYYKAESAGRVMRNIEHVISHFDNTPTSDYNKFLKINDHYVSATVARQELERAIRFRQPISLRIQFHELDHGNGVIGSWKVYAFLRIGLGSGPGWIQPNLVNMRRMVSETEELLAKWIHGEGYECPIDKNCNMRELQRKLPKMLH